MMNGDELGLEIMKMVDALSNDQKKNREAIYKAIGRAVVRHIQKKAELLTGPVVGLTSPPGGGPVTGSIKAPPGGIK